MFAVIKAAGKQYVAVPGRKIKFDKKLASKGEGVTFDEVLLVADGGNVSIGEPTVVGASVKGTVVREGRDRKITVFKYKPKKRYKKKRGHRQPFSEVMIDEIVTKKQEARSKKQGEEKKTSVTAKKKSAAKGAKKTKTTASR